MKTSKVTQEVFEDLSNEELTAIGGEGFAYDAGRAIRFLGQCGSGIPGLAAMMVDIAIARTT